ncbi:hypothetical protein NFI96_004581 [Prochilodus magdalenae]|nr:hypothetical protein NFI96_004581 [Prochilodus magdalenae]
MADEQMQEAAVEPWFRFIRPRLRSSDICRNVVGALGRGLVAGGCMGAMAAQNSLFLNGTTANQPELTTNITTHSRHPLMTVSYITYLCLLVAISSSAVGVLCGCQAYNLVRRQRGGDTSGKALALAAPVAERIFVIMLGIQMFQASCGAVLYSYFVTGEAGEVCTGAVTAAAVVLAALLKVFPMLGTGASLGVLLAVSGGAGVSLSAAGDLGQRYGGQIGRVGAIIGAAVGAFLPCYLTQELETIVNRIT